MKAFKDLTDCTFGKWYVIEVSHMVGCRTFWKCKCTCGSIGYVVGSVLLNKGSTQCKSCAAISAGEANTTHGMKGTRLYTTWTGMKRRCLNPNKNYLSNGIQVCKEWSESFEAFRDWAYANGYTDNLTIERIDVLGDYTPNNCKFITPAEQQANRTNTIRLPDGSMARNLAKANGITISAFEKRIRTGWDVVKAATFPMNLIKQAASNAKYAK